MPICKGSLNTLTAQCIEPLIFLKAGATLRKEGKNKEQKKGVKMHNLGLVYIVVRFDEKDGVGGERIIACQENVFIEKRLDGYFNQRRLVKKAFPDLFGRLFLKKGVRISATRCLKGCDSRFDSPLINVATHNDWEASPFAKLKLFIKGEKVYCHAEPVAV